MRSRRDLTLDARSALTVAYTNTGGGPATPAPAGGAQDGSDGGVQINRLDAAGVRRGADPDRDRHRATFAIYDLNRRLITMLGGVTRSIRAGQPGSAAAGSSST